MRATPGDFAVAAGLRPAPGLQAVQCGLAKAVPGIQGLPSRAWVSASSHVALLLQAAFPPGVQGDPGRGVVRVPLGLPVQRFLVNGAVACGAGGVRGVLEREATPRDGGES
jgi:hypothetical protein